MRALRVTPARQLSLFGRQAGAPADRWAGLPEQARAEVLALLARMISRGALAGDGHAPEARAGQEAGGE